MMHLLIDWPFHIQKHQLKNSELLKKKAHITAIYEGHSESNETDLISCNIYLTNI